MQDRIDLSDFGIFGLCCESCGEDLEDEVEIDNITTHHTMSFELNYQCYNCEHEGNIEFEVHVLPK